MVHIEPSSSSLRLPKSLRRDWISSRSLCYVGTYHSIAPETAALPFAVIGLNTERKTHATAMQTHTAMQFFCCCVHAIGQRVYQCAAVKSAKPKERENKTQEIELNACPLELMQYIRNFAFGLEIILYDFVLIAIAIVCPQKWRCLLCLLTQT